MTTPAPAGRPPATPATEWIKGARTAHDLIIAQVEAGHSADRITERWDQALAAYDDATATPAEREWHAGAEHTARELIQTWRDIQTAEAEHAAASHNTAQATGQSQAEPEAG